MCLITDQKEPMNVENDMTVYKVLKLIDENLWSPYNKYRWDLGKEYCTQITESDNIICFDEEAFECVLINYSNFRRGEGCEGIISYGGGFHSAISINRLRRVVRDRKDLKIFECTIPEGSSYYTDFSGLIVSNKIIINKEIS